jgi:hypothetical protein|tara:strand:+ start:1752 stop:2057 length:306 start_codon:yes stop_codon:yes gene_type:complete
MAFRMGLKPSEFWAMTPRNFQLMSEAFNENEKAAHDARAWSLATLITALGQFKKRPNPAKLFDELSGRKGRRETTSSGSEKIREIMQDSSARIKEREINGR